MLDWIKGGWAGLTPTGRMWIVLAVIIGAAVLLGMAMWLRIDLLPYLQEITK